MQRNNNQGYDLSETSSSDFLDLSSSSWSHGIGRPRTPPSPDVFVTPDRGGIDMSRHLEDMRRRTHEADFAASFTSHCDDGSAYATYENLSMLSSPSAESFGEIGSNSPAINGPGTPASSTGAHGMSVLLDDSTRILNLSIESVLIAIAAESNNAADMCDDRPRYELDERPLERSRSLENVHITKERHGGNGAEMNNNDNVQRQQRNTSACADTTNLLRELGPRATAEGAESENTTPGKASRVLVVEPLIERSFGDADETCCLTTPARYEHSLQTNSTTTLQPSHHHHQSLNASHLYNGNTEEEETLSSNKDGDRDDDSSNNHLRVNLGIYPSSAAVEGNLSETDLVNKRPEVAVSSPSAGGTMTESKMMATMPHDIVPVAHKDPQTGAGGGIGGGDGSPEVPSIAAILEAIRNNQTDQVRNQLLAVEDRLDTAESMADDLLDQNQALRNEVKDMEMEMEEAKDHYRQADIEEYRDIKADLDRAVKDYRVLQYRLRKSERRSEEAEAEKQQFEDKLHAVSGPDDASPSDDRSSEMIALSQELKVAKEVSIRLHQELEMIEDKRAKTEDENQILRRKLVESETLRKDLKRDYDKIRTEVSYIINNCD